MIEVTNFLRGLDGMKVQKVTDSSFSKYGKVLSGYGFEKLLDTLRKCSEKPSCGTIYVPSDETL